MEKEEQHMKTQKIFAMIRNMTEIGDVCYNTGEILHFGRIFIPSKFNDEMFKHPINITQKVEMEGQAFVLSSPPNFLTGSFHKKMNIWSKQVQTEGESIDITWINSYTSMNPKKLTDGIIIGGDYLQPADQLPTAQKVRKCIYTDKYGDIYCLDINKALQSGMQEKIRQEEFKEEKSLSITLLYGHQDSIDFVLSDDLSALISIDIFGKIKIARLPNYHEINHVIFDNIKGIETCYLDRKEENLYTYTERMLTVWSIKTGGMLNTYNLEEEIQDKIVKIMAYKGKIFIFGLELNHYWELLGGKALIIEEGEVIVLDAIIDEIDERIYLLEKMAGKEDGEIVINSKSIF